MLGGSVDPLLLAGHYGLLNTVSEQYARELLEEKDRERGAGLGRELRERGIPLAGITNGVDPAPYDPRTPERTGLPFRFDPSRGDLEGKRGCRRQLADRLDWPLSRPPSRGIPCATRQCPCTPSSAG